MIVVFFLSGVIVLIVSLPELVHRILRRRHLVPAEGVIVGISRKTLVTRSSWRMKTTVMHFPVIKFSKRTGEAVTFTSETGDTGPASRYAQGQRMAILYDPEGELGPMIATWSGVWLPNLMGVVAGMIFLVGAFLIYLAFWEKIVGE